MAGLRRPAWRQVEKAIPVNSFRFAANQFEGSLKSESLHFLSAKRRGSHFEHPHRFSGNLGGFIKPAWPFVDRPMVPIQGETVYSHRVQVFHDPVAGHQPNKITIAGGDSAEHNGERGVGRADGSGGLLRQIRESFPSGVEMKIPMREVIWLVPQYNGFKH